MAVAHDAWSESHSGAAGSTSEASFSWNHTPVGTPKGVLVWVTTIGTAPLETAVTYDGVALSLRAQARDTTGEPGTIQLWVLESSVPTTSPASIVVTRTNNATAMYAAAVTVTAATDIYVVPSLTREGDGALVTLPAADGYTGALRYAGIYYGGAAEPAIGQGSTYLGGIDLGNFAVGFAVENAAGEGPREVGFTDTSDDRAYIAVAVREQSSSLGGIYHEFTSQSHYSANSANQSVFTWTHYSGHGAGVFVAVETLEAVQLDTLVTYGGIPMVKLAALSAEDTATEPGSVNIWWLQNPPLGNQTVAVWRTNNATPMTATATSVFAQGGASAIIHTAGAVLLEENGAFAEQTPTFTTNALNVAYAAGFGGGSSANIAVGPSSIPLIGSSGTDNFSGASVWIVTTPLSSNRSKRVGLFYSTSDDRAVTHFVVQAASEFGAFQSDSFQNDSFQMAAATANAFQDDSFQDDAFQTPTPVCYYDEVIADTPAWYSRLGESAGTSANDEMGGTDGVYTGGYTLSQSGAVVGNDAVLLNGTTGYISVAANAALNAITDTFTLEAWVKRTTVGGGGFEPEIISKGAGSFFMEFFNDSIQVAHEGTAIIAASTVTVTDTTTWHHIVWTKSGATNKIYLDGADVTGTVTNSTIPGNTSAMNIGRNVSAAGEYLPGYVDEVAIYSTALSAGRVLAHYAARTVDCGGASTNAPAEVSTATGAANNVSAKVEPNAGIGTATGAANNATPSVAPNAGNAAGTGAANSPTSTVSVGGTGVATGTGAANTATPSVAPNGGNAGATGAANAPAASVAVGPGVATGTGSSGAPAPSVAPTAGIATGTGAAYDATARTGIDAAAEVATATGAANNVSAKVEPTAGAATATGAGNAPAPSVAPNAGIGSATGAAYTGTTTIAASGGGVATGTGSSGNPAPSVAPTAGSAGATGAAYDATVDTTTPACENSAFQYWAFQSDAFQECPAWEANAGVASGTGSAYNASVSLAPNANVATGTGAAGGPTSSVAPTAGVASATGSALAATITIAVGAGFASATGAAYGATPSVAPNAGLASAIGVAYDSTAFIPGQGAGGVPPDISIFHALPHLDARHPTPVLRASSPEPSVEAEHPLPALTATHPRT